ncbi:HupE/UreJ family protein [Ruegeria sediminis]|uniref:HupE/UreJ family protein n=1 Tax=Ruegeria sediminis TaxID=2583820 RepID=A0ABY2X1S9_9RHOB|nr:HupE/UreJ family protein [Ruegeria sediminis]TMV08927.1 HupE/UreJ family protein [Ruegeria sediminis]
MKRLLFLLPLLAAVVFSGQVLAHALQPGYLEIKPAGADTFQVLWRKPAVAGKPMAIEAELPQGCDAAREPVPTFDGAAWVAQWTIRCDRGLRGGEVRIRGLEATQTDVLVRYELEPGAAQTRRLTPDDTGFVIPHDPSTIDVIGTYLPLGVEHILGGIDHLLFVFAMLLLIRDGWRLLWAVTAFTVAHSITMAFATLGWLTLPGPPVEAVIALSIMFLASELVQRSERPERLAELYPWTVSFAFGLLHGFGFAGALSEIGLPDTDIPMALFSFNVGVEIGQLAFIAAALAVFYVLGLIAPRLRGLIRSPGSAVALCLAYAIGGIAGFWFVERVFGVVSMSS